jgi:hypothetical protein
MDLKNHANDMINYNNKVKQRALFMFHRLRHSLFIPDTLPINTWLNKSLHTMVWGAVASPNNGRRGVTMAP